eukprot:CAMPEP_0195511794 /NCGR_PEP_ID=MMETSP0794_2-20130614/3987_1 /TAXON_ID=515487 /ORGANISM="Stephanopyxis turris, Strain CCMP 815" /LENGTH=157 /DNA_ID=CAMNT_0040639451 /DNA_START=196 /DNA_END=666 /DNA_ORIENTATION=+
MKTEEVAVKTEEEEDSKPPKEKEDTGNGGQSDSDSKMKKRKERLEQNRISARESRKRKKTMIEELQRTVITLSREHKELTQRNEVLRGQLGEVSSGIPTAVSNLPPGMLMGGAGPTPAQMSSLNPQQQQQQQQPPQQQNPQVQLQQQQAQQQQAQQQ